MTLAARPPVGTRRSRWVLAVWHHPEWATASVGVAAWLAVVAGHPGHAPGGATAPMTAAMAVAMMAPSVLPAARVVALTGPWRRRYRAQAAFTGAYLGSWVLAALGLARLAAVVPAAPWVPAAALLVAAGWELGPAKRRFLRECHRLEAPRGTGWRADARCARAGLRHAVACAGACWALMAVMALTTSVPLMLVLTVVATSGKVLRQGARQGPERAAVLGTTAVYTAVL